MKNEYSDILRKELILALGCTEPIAVAYASALCKELIGGFPERIDITVSGNIVKNVKGVIVPNTGGKRGLEVAAIAGALSKKPKSKLEVLEYLEKDDIKCIDDYLSSTEITIQKTIGKNNLYIEVSEFSGNNTATVIIEDKHTHVTKMSLNGSLLHDDEVEKEEDIIDLSFMDFKSICHSAFHETYDEIKELLDMQVENNFAIAEIGLQNDFGMCIGKTIHQKAQSSKDKAISYAAAGSDARMSGSTSPVVINSGSGNQGMTISIPIYVYGIHERIKEEKIDRALIFSNLIAIYIKSKIGSLSAFCGAVSAATAVAGAITYLRGGDTKMISDTIKNAVSNLPGVICDGAKPSCAYKIYSSLDSAFLASDLAMMNQVVEDGCGIIFEDIDKTLAAVGTIAKLGMKTTDEVIIDIMTSW